MSDYIESKFRIDYRDFATLPNNHAENLYLINSRIQQMEHINKLKDEIHGLELSLAAETKLIADDILRQNIFLRFNGYEDFIGQEYVSQETLDKNPTFANYATAVEMTANDFKDPNKIHDVFEFLLENFIYIFFEGCGAWASDDIKHVVIDYDHRHYVSGSNSYPSEFNYIFNATNSKNGKTYRVTFAFYDLKRAIDSQYTQKNFPEIYDRPTLPFESIRTAGFGQILCTICTLEKSRRDGDPADSEKKIYIKSFDPLEISAFVKNVIADGKGEINE